MSVKGAAYQAHHHQSQSQSCAGVCWRLEGVLFTVSSMPPAACTGCLCRRPHGMAPVAGECTERTARVDDVNMNVTY